MTRCWARVSTLRGWLSLGLLLAYISGCAKTEGECAVSSTVRFSGASLSFLNSGGRVSTQIGPWRMVCLSSETSPARVLVVASWCRTSKELLHNIDADPACARFPDAVLLLEDERTAAIEGALASGEITEEEVQQHNARQSPSEVLLAPKNLASFEVPYFLAKGSGFTDSVTKYPTALDCTPEGCVKVGPLKLLLERIDCEENKHSPAGKGEE